MASPTSEAANSDSEETKDPKSAKLKSAHAQGNAVGFDQVHADELSAISIRRRKATGTGGPVQPCETIALALSGGGIRSAAFNLGMLQAFAEQRLLANIDYLSTVSGGGYIGGWLSSWIYRNGSARNVESQLAPSDSSRTSEPPQIQHLRANSNYLAQRPGVLSPDSWALISIYVRNVLLNLCVVIPTLLTLVSVPDFVAILFQSVARQLDSSAIYVIVCCAVLLLRSHLVFLDYRLALSEPANEEGRQKAYGIKKSEKASYILLFAGLLISLLIEDGRAVRALSSTGFFGGNVVFVVSFVSTLLIRLVLDLLHLST